MRQGTLQRPGRPFSAPLFGLVPVKSPHLSPGQGGVCTSSEKGPCRVEEGGREDSLPGREGHRIRSSQAECSIVGQLPGSVGLTTPP